jgi:hypothetical protein
LLVCQRADDIGIHPDQRFRLARNEVSRTRICMLGWSSIEHADHTTAPILVGESVALLGRASRVAQPAASPEK